MDKDSKTIIGCDLGDRTSHLRLLDAEGAVLDRTKIASTRRAFHKFFAGLDPSLVVLEVGAHSRWSSALIREPRARCPTPKLHTPPSNNALNCSTLCAMPPAQRE